MGRGLSGQGTEHQASAPPQDAPWACLASSAAHARPQDIKLPSLSEQEISFWAPFKEVGSLRSKLQSHPHNPGIPSQTPRSWCSAFQGCGSGSVVPGPAASVPPEILLETHILRSQHQGRAEMVCVTLGERKCAHPLPNSTFSDSRIGVLQSAAEGILHHGKWQTLQISAYFLFREQLPAHHWAPSRPIESETLEVGSSNLGLSQLSR